MIFSAVTAGRCRHLPKKGSKDSVPRSFKASVKRAFEEIGAEHPTLFGDAIVKGLNAAPPKSFHYLQLAAHYLDGKPTETVRCSPVLTLANDG